MAILRVRKGLEPGAIFPVFSARSPTLIGREGPVDVPLGDPKSSRRHAALSLVEGEWVVADLGSSNGTIVAGKRVESAVLEEGATLQIGSALLSFHATELTAPPGQEIHGAKPLATLREEAAVFTYRAHQSVMDREVRCDWLHPQRPAPEELSRRLEQSFEAAQRISDPGIVPVAQAQFKSGATFVLLRGPLRPTLADKLGAILKLPLPVRIEVFRGLLDAVLQRAAYDSLRSLIAPCHVGVEMPAPGSDASAPPLIHLPAIDLGALVAAQTSCLRCLPQYAPYLPPEIGNEEEAEALSDLPELPGVVYNVGALGYHLLTGQKPMGEGSVRSILENHRTLEPAPAQLLEPAIPARLSALLEKMLSKEPRRRPAAIDEVLGAFPSPPPRASQSTPVIEVRAHPAASAPASRPSPARPKAIAARQEESPREDAAQAPAEARKPRAPRKEETGVPSYLYLPLWAIAWVALFFVARYLSKMVFQSLSG